MERYAKVRLPNHNVVSLHQPRGEEEAEEKDETRYRQSTDSV